MGGAGAPRSRGGAQRRFAGGMRKMGLWGGRNFCGYPPRARGGLRVVACALRAVVGALPPGGRNFIGIPTPRGVVCVWLRVLCVRLCVASGAGWHNWYAKAWEVFTNRIAFASYHA